MIVKDEEDSIARAIDSVRDFAFEVVLVDTGSTDRTVEIARDRGAQVSFFAWTGDFSEARNRALTLSSGDWILSLDADEAATEAFRDGWPRVLATTACDGLSVPVHNIGEVENLAVVRLIRLFRHGKGYRYSGKVHEDIGASIVAAGKRLGEADLPLRHYGYTRQEDARKGRRERNLALLRAEHDAAPDNPRYWHYLALEHLRGDDHDAALPWLGRMVNEHPKHALAGWSASLLSGALTRRGAIASAWSAAQAGVASSTGRVMCLVRMGALAVAEGDPVTSAWCAAELLGAGGSPIDVAQRRSTALHLRAAATWEDGDRATAIASWLAAVREFPSDGFLADQYVRHLEEFRGGPRGGLEAMRAANTLVVAATAVGSFVRAADWAHAEALAKRCPAQTLYTAHAYLHAGHVQDALGIFAQQGEKGALTMLLWALEQRDEALVERALDGAPPVWKALAASVLRGETVSASLDWLLWEWTHTWLDVRRDAFAGRLMELSVMPAPDRGARCAKVLLDGGRASDALKVALTFAGQPDADEVCGRIAFSVGDFAAAAEFLGRRADAGDAPVRVYRCAAEAYLRTGRQADAQRVWTLGEKARPDSRLWRSERRRALYGA